MIKIRDFLLSIFKNKFVINLFFVILIIILLGFPVLDFAKKNLWVRIFGYAGLYIILGLGLLIHVGLTGLLDLGFAAFYAIGAYTYAFFASDFYGIHLSFWLMLLVGGITAGFVGALIFLPVSKLRGDYLAIVTLGFGEIVRMLLMNLSKITNGSQGIIGIDRPYLFGKELTTGTDFYYLIIALVVILVFILNRIIKSRIGRAWLAMREDEDVAELSGINTTWYKLLAFILGAFIGGLGGVVFAAWQGSIFPDNFNLMVSINVLSLIVLGGLGNQYGVIIGALILIALPDILRGLSDYRMIIFGILLIVMMIVRPDGFLPRKPPKLENKKKKTC